MNAIPRLLVVMTLLVSSTVAADPFEGSELLVGRFVKQPVGAKRFAVGLKVQFAPLNVVLSSQKDAIVDAGIDAACEESPDPAACRAAAQASSGVALDTLAGIEDSDWDNIEGALTSNTELEAQLAAAGVTDPDAVAAVTQFVNAVPEENRQEAIGITRTLASNEATMVLVEPHMEVNLKPLSLTADVPIAMMMFDNSTEWHLGNVVLDAKFGHVWGTSVAGFALSYGASFYLPTGTEESDALGLADLFNAPKFNHEYLGLAPYLVLGFQLPGLVLQGHGEIVSEHAVRGDPEFSSLQYAKYGAGLVVLPNFFVSFVGELNGMAPLNNARPYNALFGVAGLQLKLLWVRASLAAQIPISTPEKEDMASIGGVSVGELSSYSVIGRLSFTF